VPRLDRLPLDVIARLQAVAREHGWQALLLVSPENVAYAAGFVVPSQPLMRWRHAVCIVPAAAEPSLMVVDMETTTVRDRLGSVEVTTYNEFTDDPMQTLAATLERQGLSTARLGIELEYVSAADFARLQSFLPSATWQPCDRAVAQTRVIKTPAEIEHLRALSRLTDATIYAALTSIHAGMTEMDIAGRLTRGIFERGADNFKLLIVATGERSGYPNVGPTDRALEPGDLIRTEIFGVQAGYHAGVCRTAVVGEPSDEQRRIWSILIRCRDLVLGEIRPGASAAHIYGLFSDYFAEVGFPPISFVGHGIGVHLHEEPYIGRYGDATLQAGMVLGIEPLLYAPGMGLQNKDMVLVTDDGCELLSNVTPAEELIRVPA
jgi:Xaa-Pro aminopeptidase